VRARGGTQFGRLWEADQIEAALAGEQGAPVGWNGGNDLRAGSGTSEGQRISLTGPAGLRPFDAPPGIWRPGTEGPWVCQRGARASGRAWSGTNPTTRAVGRRGRGLFSGNSVGQRVFQGFLFSNPSDISLLVLRGFEYIC